MKKIIAFVILALPLLLCAQRNEKSAKPDGARYYGGDVRGVGVGVSDDITVYRFIDRNGKDFRVTSYKADDNLTVIRSVNDYKKYFIVMEPERDRVFNGNSYDTWMILDKGDKSKAGEPAVPGNSKKSPEKAWRLQGGSSDALPAPERLMEAK